MEITRTKKAHKVTVGDHVRAFDHMPIEGRDDQYVEGVVSKIYDDIIYVHVVNDTVFDFGVRLEITTPLLTMFEYEERIQVLGHTSTTTGIYEKA